MNERPAVSVIVPVYNCEAYLPRCIDSLVHQTLGSVEVILVNDGSTDNSLQICREYAANFADVVVIDQPNGGAAKARIAGIRRATGEYLTFVDGDDWGDREMFAFLYSRALATEVDIIQSGFIRTAGETIPAANNVSGDVVVFPARDAAMQLFGVRCGSDFSFTLWGKLYRRDLFDDLPLPEDACMINDVQVVARLFGVAQKVASTERRLYYYFCRNDAANGSTMDQLYREESRFILSHIEAFQNVSEFFKGRDREFYLASLKHTVAWSLSALIRKNVTPECKAYAKQVIKQAQIWGNPYIPWKKKIVALMVQIF